MESHQLLEYSKLFASSEQTGETSFECLGSSIQVYRSYTVYSLVALYVPTYSRTDDYLIKLIISARCNHHQRFQSADLCSTEDFLWLI